MPTYRVNNQIRAPEVRLIDEAGAMLGVVPWQEATRLAIERHLDLVEVNPKVQPPIVKLVDYGKLLYQERKEARQKTKTKSAARGLKVVRIGVGTSAHDLEIRARQVEAFLGEGARVGVDMVLRGREKAHPDFAYKRFTEFLELIRAPHATEQVVKRTGRGFSTTLYAVK